MPQIINLDGILISSNPTAPIQIPIETEWALIDKGYLGGENSSKEPQKDDSNLESVSYKQLGITGGKIIEWWDLTCW